jgi:uncharacterized protein (DUF1330 family)
MAPDFRFSQIDTICVPPVIDLRPNTSQRLALSGPNPSNHFLGVSHVTADEALANWFKHLGYKTVRCSQADATLDDLKTPSAAWMRTLDFGDSRWLFIVAVEYVSTPYGNLSRILGASTGLSHAVVSGYIFHKQADGGRLVWRDKVVGADFNRAGGQLLGRKGEVKLIESEYAIDWGVKILLAKFETRNKEIRLYENDKTQTEVFDVTCNMLWTALKDTLKSSGRYEIIQIDDSDMMAIYDMGSKERDRMDDAILRPEDNRCSMEITEAPHQYRLGVNDTKSLSQRVHAALSK